MAARSTGSQRNRAPLARGVSVARPQKPSVSIFLNVPYDLKFEKLFLAYISGATAFGLLPRATLEIPSSLRRQEGPTKSQRERLIGSLAPHAGRARISGNKVSLKGNSHAPRKMQALFETQTPPK